MSWVDDENGSRYEEEYDDFYRKYERFKANNEFIEKFLEKYEEHNGTRLSFMKTDIEEAKKVLDALIYFTYTHKDVHVLFIDLAADLLHSSPNNAWLDYDNKTFKDELTKDLSGDMLKGFNLGINHNKDIVERQIKAVELINRRHVDTITKLHKETLGDKDARIAQLENELINHVDTKAEIEAKEAIISHLEIELERTSGLQEKLHKAEAELATCKAEIELIRSNQSLGAADHDHKYVSELSIRNAELEAELLRVSEDSARLQTAEAETARIREELIACQAALAIAQDELGSKGARADLTAALSEGKREASALSESLRRAESELNRLRGVESERDHLVTDNVRLQSDLHTARETNTDLESLREQIQTLSEERGNLVARLEAATTAGSLQTLADRIECLRQENVRLKDEVELFRGRTAGVGGGGIPVERYSKERIQSTSEIIRLKAEAVAHTKLLELREEIYRDMTTELEQWRERCLSAEKDVIELEIRYAEEKTKIGIKQAENAIQLNIIGRWKDAAKTILCEVDRRNEDLARNIKAVFEKIEKDFSEKIAFAFAKLSVDARTTYEYFLDVTSEALGVSPKGFIFDDVKEVEVTSSGDTIVKIKPRDPGSLDAIKGSKKRSRFDRYTHTHNDPQRVDIVKSLIDGLDTTGPLFIHISDYQCNQADGFESHADEIKNETSSYIVLYTCPKHEFVPSGYTEEVFVKFGNESRAYVIFRKLGAYTDVSTDY